MYRYVSINTIIIKNTINIQIVIQTGNKLIHMLNI